jgi:hypothetical protein
MRPAAQSCGTADEFQAIKEGRLAASISRAIDNSGGGAADTFVKHINASWTIYSCRGPVLTL